jgi:hypothetical protein
VTVAPTTMGPGINDKGRRLRRTSRPAGNATTIEFDSIVISISNRWYFPFTKIPWVKEEYRKPIGCQEKPFGAFTFIRLSARHWSSCVPSPLPERGSIREGHSSTGSLLIHGSSPLNLSMEVPAEIQLFFWRGLVVVERIRAFSVPHPAAGSWLCR